MRNIVFIFLSCFLYSKVFAMSEGELNVHWYDTRMFKKFVQSVPLDRKLAGEKLLHVVSKKLGSPVDEGLDSGLVPLFYYDSYIFFRMIPKGPVWLEGYYLNVDKCLIEYRETKVKVPKKKGFMSLSNNDRFDVKFDSVTVYDLIGDEREGLCRGK